MCLSSFTLISLVAPGRLGSSSTSKKWEWWLSREYTDPWGKSCGLYTAGSSTLRIRICRDTDRGQCEHVNVEICKYLLTNVAAVFISSIMSVHVQKPWQWAEPLCCGSCSRVQCQWPLHELWRRCWPRSDLSLPGPSVWWCQSESHLSKSMPLENGEAVPFVFVLNNRFFVHLEAESKGN